jgi:aspartate aminotransferase
MVTGQEVTGSARAREALPSPMRKLAPLAAQAEAEGVQIYHLNIGQPDIDVPPELLDRIRGYDGTILPYAPSHGLSETIDAWLEYYRQVGVELDAGQLLVTNGGSEAIFFALMAVADPGDDVLVFEPSYANYFGFARMACVRTVPVTLRPEDGYHLPSAAEIEARITPRTRAILFTTPGNPTGAVFSYSELEILSDIAARHNLFLISDETYREIVFEGPRDMSMLKIERTAGQTIVVDSLSKRFSATGARIGALVSPHPEIMSGVMRFAQARLAVPTLEQLAVVPSLRHPASYTDALAAVYKRRRDTVFAALERIPGVFARRPEGAFYLLAVLPIDDGERFTSWLLTDFRSRGETLMLAPGEGFYVTPGLGRKEARFAFVLEESALERAIEILGEALDVYPGTER